MAITDVLSSPAAIAAFASTAFISLAPNIILFFLPGYDAGDGSASIWLSLGQSMAAGGLLGDVFLHTLDESSKEATGIWVLGGFTFFLLSDLLIRTIQEETGGHQHNHHQVHTSHGANNELSENGTAKSDPFQSTDIPTNRSAIILSIAGDALHNFTDGLAIGASYSMAQHSGTQSATFWYLLTNHTRGGLATLSILIHEVPHELGDFCTLVRAGYSTQQAIVTQLYTAVAAFLGTATAIVVSEEVWAEERLIWITAGGFLYLAGTTLLPQVLADERICDSESKSTTSKRWLRFAQWLSFCVGILCLYVVAVLEDGEHTLDHGSSSHHHHHHGDHRVDHDHHGEMTNHGHGEL